MDKDVKRQPLEMLVTLHGASCAPPSLGTSVVGSQIPLGKMGSREDVLCGSYGDTQYVNPALRHGPCPGSPLSFRGLLSMLCSIRSRFEVQKHCFLLCFSSCVRGHGLTVLLNDAFNSARQKMLTDRTGVYYFDSYGERLGKEEEDVQLFRRGIFKEDAEGEAVGNWYA